MDPLSLAASIFAFAQMVPVVASGLSQLRRVANASQEFLELLDELSTLHTFMDLVRRNVAAMHEVHLQSGGMAGALADLKTLVAGLELVVGEMHELVVSLLDKCSVETDKNGAPRHNVPKMRWAWEKARISRLRDRSRQIRSQMSSWLSASGSLQGLRTTQKMAELQSLVTDSCHYLAQGIQQTLAASQQSSARLEMLEQAVIDARMLLVGSDPNDPGLSSILNKPRKHPELQAVGASIDAHSDIAPPRYEAGTEAGTTAEWLTRTTNPDRTCSPMCRCQCHKSSYISTPKWLQPVTGATVIKYHGRLLKGKSACDIKTCVSVKPLATSNTTLSLQFRPPKWMPMQALNVGATFTGVGARLWVKVPTFQNLDLLGKDLSQRDFTALREKVSAGSLSPTATEAATGLTVLTWAMHYGFFDALPALLALGFDPELSDYTGRNAFQYAQEHAVRRKALPHAAYTERLLPEAFVQKLCQVLDLEASELHNIRGSTSTHEAVRGVHHVSLENCLLLNAHEIDALDSLGNAPLHYAVLLNDPAKTRTLIAHGADINIANPHTGERPLHSAMAQRRTECCVALLDAGADVNLRDGSGNTALQCRPLASTEHFHTLLARTTDPDSLNGHGDAGLHMLGAPACKVPPLSVYVETMDAYLAAGADIEVLNSYDETPLLVCAWGRPEMVPYLLARGARPEAISGDSGRSVLHWLMESARAEHMRALKPEQFLGVHVERRDKDGQTAFELLKLRIERKASDAPCGGTDDRRRLTMVDVLEMTRFMVGLREVNWSKGLFPEARGMVLEEAGGDGSHDKMRNWMALVDRRIKRDKEHEDVICESVNMWWQGYDGMQDDLTEVGSDQDEDEDDEELEFYDAEEAVSEERCSLVAEECLSLMQPPAGLEAVADDAETPVAVEDYKRDWDVVADCNKVAADAELPAPVELESDKDKQMPDKVRRSYFEAWDLPFAPTGDIKAKAFEQSGPILPIVKVRRIGTGSTDGSRASVDGWGGVSYLADQWPAPMQSPYDASLH